jgi:hypothetical protein
MVQDKYAIECVFDKETTIIINTLHYRKPFNIENNLDNFNIE